MELSAPNDGQPTGDSNRENEAMTSCGLGKWRPQWLQYFRSQRWLLVMLCSASFMMFIIEDGFTNSAITSIERRFQLSSRDVGTIISIYESTVILALLPVTYFGGRGNKPRWIAIGCFFVGVGSLLFALPHFTTDRYAYFNTKGNASSNNAQCLNSDTNATSYPDSCNDSGKSVSSLSRYIIAFGAAKVVSGLGNTPLGALGTVLLDESLTTKQNGIYFSTFLSMGTIGSAVGYLVSGVFLNIYTDITTPPGIDVSPSDPGWVGAWWIGFVIAGLLVIVISFPMGLFPRELPGTPEIRAEKAVESHKNSGRVAHIENEPPTTALSKPSQRLEREVQGIVNILKHLSINPTFVFTCCSVVPYVLLINSFAAFLPKILQNQFALTSSFSTIITGIAVIPGSVCGMFLGGWIMKRWDLKLPGLIKLVIVANILQTIAFFGVMIHCPQTQIAGLTTPYDNPDEGSRLRNLTSSCNSECLCSADQFRPVCSEGHGVGYFSPCHAGCERVHQNGTYGDCNCLSYSADLTSIVKDGGCPTNCNLLPLFVVIMNLCLVAMFMSNVPQVNIVLRSVAEHERSVACGVNAIVARTLGSIPGPIIFGAIIDSTCLQWQETCGVQGACWLYDNKSLAWRLSVFSLGCNLITVFFFSLALKCYAKAEPVGNSASNDDGQ